MKVAHLARKPISEGSVGRNILKHGTGGLNIDGTRIGTTEKMSFSEAAPYTSGGEQGRTWNPTSTPGMGREQSVLGRWPANLILIHKPGCRLAGTRPAPGYKINQWTDGAKPFGGSEGSTYQSVEVPEGVEEVWECVEGCPVRELDGQSLKLNIPPAGNTGPSEIPRAGYEGGWGATVKNPNYYKDSGGASRFFKQVQGSPDFTRASGKSQCSECGKLYLDHPEDFGCLGYDNRPFLHVLCNGKRVKL